MIDRILSILAPHLCLGCGKTGTLMCDNCKYDIINEQYSLCLACDNISSDIGVCVSCRPYYTRAWCAGRRDGLLQQLIDAHKFLNAKSASQPLADLMSAVLPTLPDNLVIVPIPTIASHIRQRGYDHVLDIGKRLSKKLNVPLDPVLLRMTHTKQLGASKAIRVKQAKEAFVCADQLSPDTIYLLIDDVVTTGATLKYAAKTLKDAGAQTVWAAAIARQSLD